MYVLRTVSRIQKKKKKKKKENGAHLQSDRSLEFQFQEGEYMNGLCLGEKSFASTRSCRPYILIESSILPKVSNLR